jgi:AhpD family alkylhydroperoxidase
MKTRIDYSKIAPAAYRALIGVEHYLNNCGLDPLLKYLVVMRASQMNHCAFCLDMHSKDLRALGETEQRIYVLEAWRETPFYSPRERAALAWTEAVTALSPEFVPDEIYEEARREFSEEELVNLTVAVAMINAWNRLGVAFRGEPGIYQSSLKPMRG